MSKYFDLLTRKPKMDTQAEWAIVLDRLPNETTKPAAVDLIVKTFPLSAEEARDLVESTPIVLLDQLPLEVAEQIKKFFSASQVPCTVTRDAFAKRKCFRAIWPEQPNLSSILSKTSMIPGGFSSSIEDEEVLTPKLNQPGEQHILNDDISNDEKEPEDKIVLGGDEKDQLKELTMELQQENESLRERIERMRKDVQQEDALRFNREIEKALAERSKVEELMKRLRQENETLQSRTKELERQLDLSVQEIARGKQQVSFGNISSVAAEDVNRLSSELKSAQEEAKQLRMEWAQAQKVLSEARAETEELKKMLEQSQSAIQHFKDESERIRREMEARIQAAVVDAGEWRKKANELNVGYAELQKEIESLKAQNREVADLKARNQQLSQENQQLAAQHEMSQKQNRDFMRQLEQQELMQKRMRAAQEIAEKEMRLKELSLRHQSLADDIHVREDALKEIISEQNSVEEEITKLRQSQKYMAEQAKLKDKSRLQRPRIIGPNLSSDEVGHSEYSPEG